MATIEIKITIDPDGFTGGQETENLNAALAAYRSEIQKAILSAYPEAEIEFAFEPTMRDLEVRADDWQTERDVKGLIEMECDRIYNEGKFWNA